MSAAPQNTREIALQLAAKGFNVFALTPGSKVPPKGTRGHNDASRDHQAIRQMFSAADMNVGIRGDTYGTTTIFILDIDGADGEAALAALEEKHGKLPETLESITRRGRHLIFQCDGPVGSSIAKLGAKLDVRGGNGYIVAPGSTVDGHVYQWKDPNKRVNRAPPWLFRLVRDAGNAPDAAPVDRTPLPGVDVDRAIKRGVEYLATAPQSVKSSGGDATAYKVAAALKDGGCTEQQALDLMLSEHWHNGCGWSAERLAQKVAHAYRYGKEQPGIDAPEAVFSVVPLPAASPKARALIVTRVCDVEAKPIEWLWPGVFALGKHSSIAGNPGLGKSQLSIFLAAAVSTGGALPDGTPCPEGDVLMITMEDDIADTIRPRLEAAGADLKRVSIVEGVPCKLNSGQDGVRSFDMTIDVQRLAEVADELPALRLIIVDPISAFMGATDSHKNAEVRSALTAISKLAESRGAALLSINHLNKSSGSEAMGRVNGSGAFVAQARAVYIVARDKDDETVRVMSPLKNNVGDDRTAFFFKVEGVTLDNGIATSRAAWLDRTEEMSADDALDKRKSTSNGSATGVAQMFLMEKLRDGSQPSKEIEAAAKEAGISSATLRRARESLGIVSGKKEGGKNGAWMLSLPSSGVEKRPGMTAADMFN
jgi:putative DNA primase/helicase